MNDRKKVITIAALVISIIGLSIGFAAFSSSLSINSRANVDPVNTFSVKFSRANSSLDEGDVSPLTGTGDLADIDNTSNPTISNLHASFTAPGQSVEYVFYARNMGPMDAYLTDIVFNNATGKRTFKSCTPSGVNPASNANSICNDIKVTIEVGTSDSKITVDSTMNEEAILSRVGSNHIISKSNTPETGTTNSEVVKVTIQYLDNGNYADGDFTVTFGDISMTFATVAGFVPDLPGQQDTEVCLQTYDKSFGSSCTYTDSDSSGGMSVGDLVTCGTETFNIIKTPENNTVTMLASYNLNVTDPDAHTYKGISNSQLYTCSTGGYQDSHVRGWVDEDDPNNLDYMKQFTIVGGGSGSGSGSYYGSGSGGSGSGSGSRFVYLPYGTVAFWSETAMDSYNYDWNGYWTNNPSDSLNSNFTACTGANCYDSNGIQYPVNVYGISNSNNGATATLTSHVNNYVQNLNTQINGAGAHARLITYDELIALGCSGYNASNSCTSAPAWVYQTSYWSGSAGNYRSVWYVGSDVSFGNSHFDIDDYYGVRPVIEISSSVIQAS